jgi:hypothetical protein
MGLTPNPLPLFQKPVYSAAFLKQNRYMIYDAALAWDDGRLGGVNGRFDYYVIR